jgi:hypothetical protein
LLGPCRVFKRTCIRHKSGEGVTDDRGFKEEVDGVKNDPVEKLLIFRLIQLCFSRLWKPHINIADKTIVDKK